MSTSTYIAQPNPTGVDLTPSVIAFLEFVSPDLEAVEQRLHAEVGDEVRTVYGVTRHLLNAGGKRLRPAMVALAARAINPNISEHKIAEVGAAVEFVHMATLVHDDVVDNTATRRGKPTANAVFGNGVAVLTGDYILARALRILANTGDIAIIRVVSEITAEMSEGEIMEINATGNPNLSRETYYEILRKKTAIFVEGCCRCGALLAGGDEAHQNALANYGYALGMAFQLADDLLDYTGDPAVTGKPRGSDLRDGRATLPFLLGIEAASPTERERLLTAFGDPYLKDDAMLEICDLLAKYDCFAKTRAAACQYVENSDAALSILPPTTARECFTKLTEYVVVRDR